MVQRRASDIGIWPIISSARAIMPSVGGFFSVQAKPSASQNVWSLASPTSR